MRDLYCETKELMISPKALQKLSKSSPGDASTNTFLKFANEAIARQGDPEKVIWAEVEQDTISSCIRDQGIPPEVVAEMLCKHSPGAVFSTRQFAIRADVAKQFSENLEKIDLANKGSRPVG